MTALTFSRIAYPILLIATAGAAMVVPVVRVRRRTKRWPLGILHNATAAERAMSAVLMLLAGGLAGWAVAYGLLGPMPLGVWPGPPALQWAGWVTVATGLVIVVVAQTQMGLSWRLGIDDGRTPLITSGLYRLARNPIYTGVHLVLGGVLLVSPAWLLIGLVVPTAALLIVQTRREERHLRRIHGEAFDRWAARTGRFVPWLGRLRSRCVAPV